VKVSAASELQKFFSNPGRPQENSLASIHDPFTQETDRNSSIDGYCTSGGPFQSFLPAQEHRPESYSMFQFVHFLTVYSNEKSGQIETPSRIQAGAFGQELSVLNTVRKRIRSCALARSACLECNGGPFRPHLPTQEHSPISCLLPFQSPTLSL
jgi:hypothetical protein